MKPLPKGQPSKVSPAPLAQPTVKSTVVPETPPALPTPPSKEELPILREKETGPTQTPPVREEEKIETQPEPEIGEVLEKEVPPVATTVIATRNEQPLDRVSRSVSVITRKDIEEQGSFTLVEPLRNIPGVRISTLGSLGDQSTIQIRGTRTFDTVILRDGMPVRDASFFQGDATPLIEDLFTHNVEQIEVLRGTGSTLYGSEAIGGVVDMRMKRGEPGRPRAKVTLEAGSLATYRQNYELSGGGRGADYLLSYARVASDNQREVDDYLNNSYSANIGYKPVEDIEARFLINANNNQLDVNDGPAFVNGALILDSADPNSIRNASSIHYQGSLQHRLGDHFQQTVRLGIVDSDRRFRNGIDTIDRTSLDSQFNGYTSNVEYQADTMINEYLTIISGVEHEREEMEQVVSERNDEFAAYRFGGYSQANFSFLEDTLNFSAGGRLSYHKKAHTHQTGELSASYLLKPTQTRFKGHFGTGYREPSLYEQHGRTLNSRGVLRIFGNPDLKPEKSFTWDVGVTQNILGEKFSVGGTFFKTEYSKRIIFLGSGYNNVAEGITQGGEFEAVLQPLEDLKLSGSYTRTFSEAGGASIPGIPRNMFGIDLTWRFLDRFEYNTNLTHRGNQQILVFSNTGSHLIDQGSYTKVDMKLAYLLSDRVKVWARADNIFNNHDIIEDGYRNPGAQFYGGTTLEV